MQYHRKRLILNMTNITVIVTEIQLYYVHLAMSVNQVSKSHASKLSISGERLVGTRLGLRITIFQLTAIYSWHLTFVKSASACRSSPAGILSHAPADTEGGSLLQSAFASVKLFRASSKPARSFCPSVRRFWTVSETSFKESLSSVSSVIYESEKVKVTYQSACYICLLLQK